MRNAREGLSRRAEGAVTLRYIHTTGETRSVRRGMIVFDRNTFSESMIIMLPIAEFYHLIFRAKKDIGKRNGRLFHNRPALNFNYVIDYLPNVK